MSKTTHAVFQVTDIKDRKHPDAITTPGKSKRVFTGTQEACKKHLRSLTGEKQNDPSHPVQTQYIVGAL